MNENSPNPTVSPAELIASGWRADRQLRHKTPENAVHHGQKAAALGGLFKLGRRRFLIAPEGAVTLGGDESVLADGVPATAVCCSL